MDSREVVFGICQQTVIHEKRVIVLADIIHRGHKNLLIIPRDLLSSAQSFAKCLI
jgi:hypothetical protein